MSTFQKSKFPLFGTVAGAIGLAVCLATTGTLTVSQVLHAKAVAAAGAKTSEPNNNLTVIFKDPDGPWPGERFWIGSQTRQFENVGQTLSVRIPVLIDARTGLDI